MKIILKVLLAVLFLTVITEAQSYRVGSLADRLRQEADELADRIYEDFRNRSSNNRSDVENLMIAGQLSAAVGTFQRMVQDRRNNSELRDAASLLVDLSRRFPNFGSNSFAWRGASRTIDDISRELGSSYGGGSYPPPQDESNIIGRVHWRGRVDDETQLVIRGETVQVRTISGTDQGNGNFTFTSPLPNRRVAVEVQKIKGRGNVRVLQQPTRENDFSTVIQIRDEGSGAREYEVEVIWRR